MALPNYESPTSAAGATTKLVWKCLSCGQPLKDDDYELTCRKCAEEKLS